MIARLTRESELGEDLVRVFAEGRRRTIQGGRSLVEARGGAGLADPPCDRVIRLDDDASRFDLRVFEDLREGQDRGAGDLLRVEPLEPFLGRARDEDIGGLVEPLLRAGEEHRRRVPQRRDDEIEETELQFRNVGVGVELREVRRDGEAELLLASPTYNCDGTQVHKVRRAIRRDSARIFASRDGAAALYR